MTRIHVIPLSLVLLLLISCRSNDTAEIGYNIHNIPFHEVKMLEGFWAERLDIHHQVTIPHCFEECEKQGRIENFVRAAGLAEGGFTGVHYFDDTDLFKVIEGACYDLMIHPDVEHENYVDSIVSLITAAQEENGYLNTKGTIEDRARGNDPGDRPASRWDLYNMGHFYEAAVAHYKATGKRDLLDAAILSADHVYGSFLGPDTLFDVSGHPGFKVGLIKLYHATGDPRYLDLARFFLDLRGRLERRTLLYENSKAVGAGATGNQDHKPVLEQEEAVGHAVRAGYLFMSMPDMADAMGEKAYLDASARLWDNVVGRKLYITGGMGACHDGERFGDNYELPNLTAYCETCAAIALVFWSQRMFRSTGEARYLDVLERTLFNAYLAGTNLEGDRFFYVNPLESDGEYRFNNGHLTRQPWYRVPCCPGNICRFMPQVPGFIYARENNDIYVNQFIQSSIQQNIKGRNVVISQEHNYPWEGKIIVHVETDRPVTFKMNIRIPGWAVGIPVPGDLYTYKEKSEQSPAILLNGETLPSPGSGFVTIEQRWSGTDRVEIHLPMEIKTVRCSEEVEVNRNKLAIERGPLVYCLEEADNGKDLGNFNISSDNSMELIYDPGLLTGMTILTGEARLDRSPINFTAIPYFAWNNRGPGKMAVWLKEAR